MQITKFKINDENDAIILQIINAQLLDKLLLFTKNSYKDYSLAKDISHLIIEGAEEQNIEISIDEISATYFDGIYIIEAISEDDISSALEYDLTRYEECILEKLSEFKLCDECLQNKSLSLINSHALLIGIKDSVNNGFIEEAFEMIKTLDIYCSNKCRSCGNYKNVIDNNFYDYNTPEQTNEETPGE